MKPETLEILKKSTVNFLITGSSALPFESIQRESHDVDLVFGKEEDLETFIKDIKEHIYSDTKEYGYEDVLVQFKLKTGDIVDCFLGDIYTGQIYNDSLPYTIDSPFNIAKAKLKILFDRKDDNGGEVFAKHFNDIKRMLGIKS